MTMMMNWRNSRSELFLTNAHNFSEAHTMLLSLSDRICFAAPAVNRKRIAVSLDMNDLMAKMK